MLILAIGAALVGAAAAGPAAPAASPSPAPATARPAATPTPRPRVPAVLDGTVRGPDGRPLAGALVIARDEQPEVPRPPATARATETGQFHLTLPPGLAFLVRVEAAGLAPSTVRHVRPGPPLVVSLARGASIEGVVRESAGGTPVANATVEARGEMRSPGAPVNDPDSGVVRTTTDLKGHFRLDGLAAGLHTLTAYARNVGRAEKRGAATGRAVELGLVPGGAIAGRVTDTKNKPVEGAVVRAGRSIPTGWGSTLLARTDSQGAYVISGVPPGAYRVAVTHPDLAPGMADTITVERDAEARADVTLSAPAFVRGRLVGVGEKPTRGWIAWRSLSGEPLPDLIAGELNAEAGEDGVFKLRVGPGAQVVEAGAPGLALRRIDVDVPVGSEGVDLGDVALEVGIAIRGHVRDAAGRPIERASVSTWSEESDREYTAQTEGDGAYTLAGLTPGLYSLSATAAGMGRGERKAEAGAVGIDFVLQAGGTITGAVVDEAGKPVEAFKVSARRPMRMGSAGDSRSDTFGSPDGRFALEDVPQGEYVVDVGAPERAPTAVSGVKVAAGGTADVGTVRLTAGGTVKGTVVDAASAPVAGASVWVSGAARDMTRMPAEVITDSGGAFEVHGVTPGPVQVRATHSAYTPGLTSGIDVDPAKGPAEVRIVLTQGGRIEGHVVSRTGALPAGAVVTSRSLAPGSVFYGPGGPVLQPVGADGTFVLEHVATGAVAVTLMAGGGGRYQGVREVRTQVREGETTAVEIVLRTIAISGKVTRAGAPLAGARIEFQSLTRSNWYFGSQSGTAETPPNVAITREDGGYDLVVSEPGETYVTIQTADRRSMLPTPPVTVPDADAYVADFNVSGAFLEGIVVDKETEQPLTGAVVWAQLADPKAKAANLGGAEAGGDGRFRIEVEPGEYRLMARADGYGSDGVDVSVGSSGTSGLRVALARGLSIKGRVVDTAGRGIGGLTIAGRTGEGPMAFGSYGWGRALADGSFEVAGLRDAPYTLSTQADGGLFAVAIGVTPGDKMVTLTLRPGGRVQVKVTGADGAPAASQAVTVSRFQGAPVTGGLGYGQTDASGQAELLVPAGTLELTARSKGLEGKTTVTVPSGGAAAAELTLKPTEQ